MKQNDTKSNKIKQNQTKSNKADQSRLAAAANDRWQGGGTPV
jgi:hypothetical protein